MANTNDKNNKSNVNKWRYTLWTVALFLIVSHPKAYETTNNAIGNVMGQQLATNGCPTIAGLLVHAIIFGIALRYMMDMKL